MSGSFKIFPRRDQSNRSCEFTVGCGEAGLMTGFNIPCDYAICVNKLEGDKCSCEHFEKEYCQLGERAGLNDESCEAVIAMPGRYVAVLCYTGCEEEPPELESDWSVYVNVCKAHQNLQTMAMAASLESN